MSAHDDATAAQVRAADPDSSTWLSANAGSGKTRVLTDRVARLLLEGVPPQNILCLTYTKAAASEMQNRLFQRLGAWAMRSDADLAKDLATLGVAPMDDLNAARRLFARAIETPGGLKIQTIHSFCAALLRRFPLEAGVTPNFAEMDDRAARILREEAQEDIARGDDADLLQQVAMYYSGDDLGDLADEIARHRPLFSKPLTQETAWNWFGLSSGFCEADLPNTCFDGSERALVARAGPILAGQSATMVTLAETLASLNFDEPGSADLQKLYRAFLYSGRSEPKLGSVPTKKAQAALGPDLLAEFHEFMRRVASTRDADNSLYSARKTLALHRFAHAFLNRYEALKSRRGWVDFDDLILRAGTLLNDPGVAAWVLYRLDGGIDHILVDEAQDTSPAQWQVIAALAREFTTGESARSDIARTLFVVGDPKQSIYSFQGAEPAAFEHMRKAFGTLFEAVDQRLFNRRLTHSFRSSPGVLDLVDLSLRELSGLQSETLSHRAFHEDKPGRVDLWPPVPKEEYTEDRHWTDTSDIERQEDHAIRLAREVARDISRILEESAIQDSRLVDGQRQPFWRRVEPKDILILVRKRTDGLFDEIIRACKEARLPIAGADQLRVGAELAVKDLVALLRFLATPEDDLSLAAALRSPLFGLSEADLFALAHPRPKGTYLWAALRDGSSHPATTEILKDLRNHADFLRPYDLIEHILVRHRGRARLLARLGAEAQDGIDALLSLALGYERLETPSLTGFLVWLDADEVKVKRQMDGAGNRIRVLTVHGAKGLEAPIVFLPDTNKTKPPKPKPLMRAGDGSQAIWRPNAEHLPHWLQEVADQERQAAQEEWVRLLYVAMTRAGQWLIVAAAGDVGEGEQSWYSIVEKGLTQTGAARHAFGPGEGLRLETGTWKPAETNPPEAPKAPADLPGWCLEPAAPVPAAAAPLSPSDLGGAKVLGGDGVGLDAENAKRRGSNIHRLLEHLPGQPESDWPILARGLLPDTAQAEREDVLTEAAALLRDPAIFHVFGPDTLAEVEIVATLDDPRPLNLSGVIDRLIVRPDSVLAVDFKSNALVPGTPAEVPEGLLRQMGAYRAMLMRIYPDKRIETALLWTKTAQLMTLPDDLVMRAFGRLDADPSAT